jgi:hypothetical protein
VKRRPDEGERKDRRARIWVGVGIAILLISVVGNVVLGLVELNLSKENLNSQNDHHATTVKKDDEILTLLQTVHEAQMTNQGTLVEIKSLATAVNNVIAGLPAANTYLGKLAVGLEGQIQSLCDRVGATCSNLPVTLPSTTSSTSHVTTSPSVAATPTTTTTTNPPHVPAPPGRGHGGHRGP